MTKKKEDNTLTEKKSKKVWSEDVRNREEEIIQLTKEVKEKEDIAKRAQSDYMRLKLDMDAYVSRTESAKEDMKLEWLISIAKKLLPSVYQLKLMTDSCPTELQTSKRAEGVMMLYTKLTKELESLGIVPIETVIGSEPNLTYHAPVSSEPTKDNALQGKITKELQQGYLYRKGEIEKVIIPATVVLGV